LIVSLLPGTNGGLRPTFSYRQRPRFSVANFAKFRGAIIPKYPFAASTVGVVVLTDNTSKYKEFIVTCNTKTHYIGPLMMKVSS